MAETNWYAVRAVPGSQRMARPMAPANDLTEDQKAMLEKRKGESILERNLRNEGINVYMPSFWTITQHQRTNRLMEKRFPMLVGYAFVNIHAGQFEQVRAVDGVMCFMRPTPERGPIIFRETDIGGLILADFQRQRQWERERELQLEKAQKPRRDQLNKRLGLIFPKGRKQKLPMKMIAEAAINSLTPASRQHVLAILAELTNMDNEMEACRASTSALYSAA